MGHRRTMRALAGVLVAAGLLALLGCTGSPGDTWLKYYWIGTPLAFLDTNPSTPSPVYNDEYFRTGTGDFYMEFVAWDGSAWWMDYTIAADPGGFFGTSGDDAWFEIDLFSSGPTLYQWSWEKSIEARITVSKPTTPPAAAWIRNPGGAVSPTDARGPYQEQSMRSGGYIITARYGRLQDPTTR